MVVECFVIYMAAHGMDLWAVGGTYKWEHSGGDGPAPGTGLAAVQDPRDFGKTDVPVQLQNRCESAMRGLGCGSRIERSVVSS